MAISNADLAKIADAVGKNVVDTSTGATINGVLRRTDAGLPSLALEANVDALKQQLAAVATQVATLLGEVPQQTDPAAIATAVVQQLAANGETADTIAQHVLAGLTPDLAAEVVAAMGAKLSA